MPARPSAAPSNPDDPAVLAAFSRPVGFSQVNWKEVPDEAGVYLIFDHDELIYIGMSGRNGKGSLRNRLRDHSTGQIVNMFAQYLFLARVQFLPPAPITHPREAKRACQSYIRERCAFRFKVLPSGAEARQLEDELKRVLKPALNPTGDE